MGRVPAAGARPWKASKSTFTYKDKEAQAAGLKVLRVKPRDDGKAEITAKSQGTELGSPAPPLMLPGPPSSAMPAAVDWPRFRAWSPP